MFDSLLAAIRCLRAAWRRFGERTVTVMSVHRRLSMNQPAGANFEPLCRAALFGRPVGGRLAGVDDRRCRSWDAGSNLHGRFQLPSKCFYDGRSKPDTVRRRTVKLATDAIV